MRTHCTILTLVISLSACADLSTPEEEAPTTAALATLVPGYRACAQVTETYWDRLEECGQEVGNLPALLFQRCYAAQDLCSPELVFLADDLSRCVHAILDTRCQGIAVIDDGYSPDACISFL